MPEIFRGRAYRRRVGSTTLVALEMMAVTRGLGIVLLNAAAFLASDVFITGMIVIGFPRCA